MSTFPYNGQRYDPSYRQNGPVMPLRDAEALAETVRFWHGEIIGTDDWTQSSDGAEGEIHLLALGLVTALSDPGHVRMLIDVGEATYRSLDTIRTLNKQGRELPEWWDAFYAKGEALT